MDSVVIFVPASIVSDWLASQVVLLWCVFIVGTAVIEALRPGGSGGRALWLLAICFAGNYLLWSFADKRIYDSAYDKKHYSGIAEDAGGAMFFLFLGAIPCLLGFALWRLRRSARTPVGDAPLEAGKADGPQAKGTANSSREAAGCALAIALLMLGIVVAVLVLAGPPGAR